MNKVTLFHGAGGNITHRFIKHHIIPLLDPYIRFDVGLEALDDAGVYNDIVFSTDSYTVKPLFFNGGDIGRLSIAGTVNDISSIGGKPVALSLSLIMEEGLSMDELDKILKSIGHTCKEAGVDIITGDTKVVEKGSLDKMIINTSGIGVRHPLLDANMRYLERGSRWLMDSNLRAGDKIIVSGTIGDHGMAILSSREGYGFEHSIESDVMPLNRLVDRMLEVGGIANIGDPTRGGIANLLNEWSESSDLGIMIYEDRIPIREDVKAAASFLGLDPLEVGNEGKLCIAVVDSKANELLDAIRSYGFKDAEIIGEVTDKFKAVAMKTIIGGTRIIPKPAGDPVPRIC